jgi:hypothetical protein
LRTIFTNGLSQGPGHSSRAGFLNPASAQVHDFGSGELWNSLEIVQPSSEGSARQKQSRLRLRIDISPE